MRLGPFDCGLRGPALVAALTLHGATAVVVLASALPPWAQAVLLAGTAASAVGLRPGGTLQLDRRGWWWQPRNGLPTGPLRLLPGGYRGPRLVIVHLHDGRRRRTRVLLRDGHPADAWRRLAVRLGG